MSWFSLHKWRVDWNLWLLESENEIRRNSAAVALSKLADERALEPLFKKMDFKGDWVIIEHVEFFVDLIVEMVGIDRALNFFVSKLFTPIFIENHNAAFALGYMQDPRAIPHLLKSLRDGCATNQVGIALAKFGHLAQPGLMEIEANGDEIKAGQVAEILAIINAEQKEIDPAQLGCRVTQKARPNMNLYPTGMEKGRISMANCPLPTRV